LRPPGSQGQKPLDGVRGAAPPLIAAETQVSISHQARTSERRFPGGTPHPVMSKGLYRKWTGRRPILRSVPVRYAVEHGTASFTTVSPHSNKCPRSRELSRTTWGLGANAPQSASRRKGLSIEGNHFQYLIVRGQSVEEDVDEESGGKGS